MDAVLKSLQSEWRRERPEDMARVPLYHQLYLILKAAILDGVIGYEEQMPTEQQLISAFEVSRVTAKRAMDELAADKLVARQRGKGSHVIHRYNPRLLQAPLVGMLDSYRELARQSSATVVSIGRIVPPVALSRQLGTAAQERVLKIVRTMQNLDGIVYSCYTSWTPGTLKGLTRRRLERRSRLDLLEEAGLDVHRVRQVLGAEPASIPVSSWLNVKPGESLLSLERYSYDRTGRCVDILFGLYNPKLFKYSMETS